MSMAIAHFAVGAALTTLVVTLLVPGAGYPRSLVLAGGGWAMLPDFYWASPVAVETLRELHQTAVWTDLFWFHRTLDRLDPTDSAKVASVALAGFIVVTIWAERRSYRTPAPIRSAYESYLDIEPVDYRSR